MTLPKLTTHNKVGDFHYFELEGRKGNYAITVIKLPDGFSGSCWRGDSGDNGYYKVINEDKNTEKGSNYSYSFVKYYFDKNNTEYLPYRIGISDELADDFMDCVSKFVYSVI